jgi:small subunit ribosomal protein S16
MAVKIRLRRTGKKKEVHYRIVVTEASAAREGSFIEAIGYVNPRLDPPQVRLNEERAKLWLGRGAQPTDTVRSILIRQGLLEKTRAGAKREATEAAAIGEES